MKISDQNPAEKGMKKILITGSNGFLGSNLVSFFSGQYNCQVITTSRHNPSHSISAAHYQGDLLNCQFVDSLFSDVHPDIVINTVSLVNVDQCNEDPAFAHKITVETAENIAKACVKYNSRLLYISTDHLFDGKKAPYSEDEKPAPVNEYGKKKLEAELISRRFVPDAVIIRTNFFGISPPDHAITFGEWVYKNLRDQNPMNLFTDYYFTPIEVHYLAECLDTIIATDFSGIINVAGSQRCSKYEFGIELAKIGSFDTSRIIASQIAPDSFKAPRQPDLSLTHQNFERIFHKKLPTLRESLLRFYDGCKKGCIK